MVTGIAFHTSPNTDELPHVAAGLYHWQTGRFDAYQVNPPLVRMWCTWPIAIFTRSLPWPKLANGSAMRLEWTLDRFLRETWDGVTLRRVLVVARLMNLPITALGGVYCFRWGRVIAGTSGGLAALIFWASCPEILACSASVCPDAAGTTLGLVASFHLCRNQLADHPVRDGIGIGFLIGLAILAKTTMVILLLPTLGFRLWEMVRNGGRHELVVLTTIGLATLATINLGYGYWKFGVPLGDFPFRCQTLTENRLGCTVNRFSDHVLGRLPVPLPFDFVQGMDRQKEEFERGKRSYLLGTWKDSGWYQYYLIAACFKLPEGMLGAFVAAHLLPGPPHTRYLSVIGLTMFAFVSSQAGFSHHFRYALPAVPYFIIHSSTLFAQERSSRTRCLAWTLLFAACASGLFSWPQCHSFFNNLAEVVSPGKPPLIESNLDWGEDLGLAVQWANIHLQARPLYHAVVTPDLANWMPVEWHPAANSFPPGWYIVSLQRLIDPTDSCHRFRHSSPIAKIGRSLRVYRINDTTP